MQNFFHLCSSDKYGNKGRGLGLFFSSLVLVTILGGASRAIASDPLTQLSVVDEISDRDRLSQVLAQPPEDIGPITNVTALTDVRPTDWAFQALKTLVERYGILQGYPDGTFRGTKPLTRYEFATAVNAAAEQIELLGFATKEDLEKLQQLLNEFKLELERSEKEIARVERSLNQFSATTKLSGEVIFGLTGVGRGEKAESDDRTDSEIALGSRLTLELSTSFIGRDLLRTTLKTGNIGDLSRATDTNMARLSFQGDQRSTITLDELFYRRRLNKKLRLNAVAVGGSLSKFAETFNPFAESSSDGVISRFAQRNPIYRQGGGAGLGLSYDINDLLTVSAGYLADNADNTREGGLFRGSHAAIAQLTFDLSKTAGFGLTYVRTYNSLETGTGSERANAPFRNRSQATTADSFGLQAAVGITPKFALSGWAGFTRAQAQDLPSKPSADIFNWALMFSFPDLLKQGNLGGIIIGQPPKVTRNEFIFRNEAYEDRNTTFHLEAFYRYQISDSISVTPGLLVLVHPEHNSDNSLLYIGTIRTSFSF